MNLVRLDAWEAERLRKGDAQAAERVIRREYSRVLRFLVHLTGNLDDAQDLGQQIFGDLAKVFEGYEARCSVRTWLHRVAYRQFTNLRRRATWESIDDNLACSISSRSEDAVVLAAAIAALPDDLRLPFLLCEIQQLKVVEAAAVLQIPAGTVKSRCFAARQKLRTELAETFGMEPHPKPELNTGGTQ